MTATTPQDSPRTADRPAGSDQRTLADRAFHLIGIGGAGMSVVAQLLADRGAQVSGSDSHGGPAFDHLADLGITTHLGHDAANVPERSTVVVSTAIKETNPELAQARRRGQDVIHRSQALALAAQGLDFVAVAGAHGKTTTSGMLAEALTEAGADPSFAIGGVVRALGAGAHLGSGPALVAEADESVTALVSTTRQQVGQQTGEAAAEVDAGLAEAASELRLVKDPWEIDQLRAAVAATKAGFDDLIRSIPRARSHWRGERVLEGAFGAKAREEGNGLGYDTIAAAGNHANTLHWINNDGAVEPGQLVLVDAGVEVDSLYTADVTRTIPVDGRFTEAQRRIYQAVLDAADAAFARAGTPGCRFKDVHAAAMEVIAARLEEWGMLPEGVSAADSLAPEGQYHRRWMVHGTSHHLGLDVHDCAQARREMYMEAELKPGMCFTIEPGLYFRQDDLLVPAEMRGTGVRIEDDIVVREDGSVERLTQDVPRTVEEVEAWVSGLIAD